MPAPPACACEADAIILSAWIAISLSILIFLMLLMLFMYYAKGRRQFLPILVVYLFSIILGMGSISIQFPITPYFQIFFMLFQSVYFILTTIDMFYEGEK